MKSLIILSLLSTGLLQFGRCENFGLDSALISLIGKFDSIVNTGNNIGTVWNLLTNGNSDSSKEILQEVGVIKNKLDQLDQNVLRKLDNIEKILQHFDRNSEIREMRRSLSVGIQSVNEAYDALSIYVSKPESVTEAMLNTYLSEYYDKVQSFVELQKTIAPSSAVSVVGAKSLPGLLADQMSDNIKEMCGMEVTPQQYLMNLFLLIFETEVKATELLAFMGLLKFRDEQGWDTYRTNLVEQYETRNDAYASQFSSALHKAPSELRTCDPAEGWIQGVTYWELNGFNQATMFRAPSDWLPPFSRSCEGRAMDLNDAKSRSICPEYNVADCYDNPKEICDGTLKSCFATEVAERCIPNDPLRRYTWIKDHYHEKTYGRVQDGCRDGVVTQKGSGWGACLCHCIGTKNKISLEFAMSLRSDGRVITGMRIKQKHDTIFIQIQEGKLGPYGKIIRQYDAWLPRDPPADSRMLMNFDSIENSFHTNTLMGSYNDVLIGVGFRTATDNPKRVSLQIMTMPYRRKTGALLGRPFTRITEDEANDYLPIGDKNSAEPIHSPVHVEDSQPEHHVRFYRSLLSEDAGQTTVPLFDATPVEGDPPFPLRGAGLLHKGAPGYAGFLALKAIGPDVAYYFDQDYLPRR